MKDISIERIQQVIRNLCAIDNRVPGSDGEKQAAEFVKGELRKAGFDDIKEKEFIIYGWTPKSCVVCVTEPVEREIPAALFPYSPGASLSAELVPINHSDTVAVNRKGKVGLAPWGPQLYLSVTKSYYHARRLDLSALLISSPDEGNLLKTVVIEAGGPTEIPVISISKEDGEFLSELMESSEVRVNIGAVVDADERATSTNLEVVIEGNSDDDLEVIMGAHYDAWFKGAADNAAPVAIVLELARLIKNHVDSGGKIQRTVRFLFFGAEEAGSTDYYYWLNGSKAYVNENPEIVRRTCVMLSLDSVGFHAQNYVTTTLELHEFATRTKPTVRNPPEITYYSPPAYGRDHWFFEINGVPVIYGVSFPSPLYHTQKDDPDHLDYKSVEYHTKFMREALLHFANSTILPYDIFAPLERFEKIVSDYNIYRDNPFDLLGVLRKIRRLLSEKRSFQKSLKRIAGSQQRDLIAKANKTMLSAIQRYNGTIGWLWRKRIRVDVDYLARLDMIADYMDINAAIGALRRMPIANLDADTVERFKRHTENPYAWFDIHDPLQILERERARVFEEIENELSSLSEMLDAVWEEVKALEKLADESV
ncbi:MAG: M28 family peptidase [Candidatus Thorarchaeota archaeon]